MDEDTWYTRKSSQGDWMARKTDEEKMVDSVASFFGQMGAKSVDFLGQNGDVEMSITTTEPETVEYYLHMGRKVYPGDIVEIWLVEKGRRTFEGLGSFVGAIPEDGQFTIQMMGVSFFKPGEFYGAFQAEYMSMMSDRGIDPSHPWHREFLVGDRTAYKAAVDAKTEEWKTYLENEGLFHNGQCFTSREMWFYTKKTRRDEARLVNIY